jgi:hypothetical protein
VCDCLLMELLNQSTIIQHFSSDLHDSFNRAPLSIGMIVCEEGWIYEWKMERNEKIHAGGMD